ncbi:4-(cytidine 5'-diphospho)-2-C-methyl-D-erythritol kinase [Dyadobacter sp. 32]|uniref:4-(cytidine 5'-diphospho)-2-C-methyl-D-erythritol kinase n=1 Tax=Dyadobacter sp. 32 TaxID=538966 RepID=UPI0011EE9C05
MLLFPNAKINIGLNIVAKRPDGFHCIESCFYPVGWSDALEMLPAERFSFRTSGITIPGNPDENLCVKAYNLLAEDYAFAPVDMHLLKSVPIGAGMGGGSSDAAYVIKGLNELFSLNISEKDQIHYARRLGSDCAFFIRNQPMFCFNKGDEFEEIELRLTGKWIVLVNPGVHISTQEAYSGVVPQRPAHDLRILLKQQVSDWNGMVINDFEATLFQKYPLLQEIKSSLYVTGAKYTSMTGSGSSIYGIFDKQPDLKKEFKSYKVWQGELL